ncbi:MAG: hypothetical protein EA349_00580 [Halomonadaceae bacterium]|nr:MAG: hypothetical protein EA349_00580 [Halomonadaceae bacterium]
MDALIGSYAWIIVTGWGGWLAALGVAICVAVIAWPRLDSVIRIPLLLFWAIATLATAVVTLNTGAYPPVAERLAQAAPGHPALAQVEQFEETRDWTQAVSFYNHWQGFIAGEELQELQDAARELDSPLGEEIRQAVATGAIPERQFAKYTEALQ